MAKKLKKIPKFRNEHEEAEFWNSHDSTDYLDWSKAKSVLNWQPKTSFEEGMKETFDWYKKYF